MAFKKYLLLASLPLVFAHVPAEAQRVNSISASERAQGAQENAETLQQFGGAYGGKAGAYVSQVGRRIAFQSGIANSESAYTVTLLNSNVMNAFALPGGYVYVTRQLLATMNDEAELAFVLGHEVGHVAAHHSRKRQTGSTLGAIGAAILGAVTGSSTVANIASQGAQFVLLGYSRDQEYEADRLGVRYLGQASYDPYAAPDMLQQLGAATNLEAALKGERPNQTPTWASTHPLTSDRVARARALAQQLPAGSRLRNRDAFLDAIDGMLMDDDPHQGVVEGRSFRHPDLGIGFDAPAGYSLSNAADAVTVSGTGGQAQFASAAFGGSLEAYVDGVFRSLAGGQGQVTHTAPSPVTVNGFDGLSASARANTDQGQVDVTVVALRTGPSQAFHFVTITPAGSGIGPFGALIGSFHRLSAAERASIRPRYLAVVTVRPGDTIQSLAARMAYPDRQQERFVALNGLTAQPEPGSRVKLVVFERPAPVAAPVARSTTTVMTTKSTSTKRTTTTRRRTRRR